MIHVDRYLIITLFLFKVDLYNTLICNHCNGTYPESLNGIKDENQGFATALKILTNNHTVCNNVNDLGTPLQCPKSFTMCTEIKVTLNRTYFNETNSYEITFRSCNFPLCNDGCIHHNDTNGLFLADICYCSKDECNNGNRPEGNALEESCLIKSKSIENISSNETLIRSSSIKNILSIETCTLSSLIMIILAL